MIFACFLGKMDIDNKRREVRTSLSQPQPYRRMVAINIISLENHPCLSRRGGFRSKK